MNVIQLDKGTGKSVVAIRQALTKRCPLVVPTERSRQLINELIKNLTNSGQYTFSEGDIKKLKILTWREFITKLSSEELVIDKVVIDDFDKIMEMRFHIDPKNITITTE